MKIRDTSILSDPIESSVRARGVSPSSVWLDRSNAAEKGVRRCEALLRMVPNDRPPFSLLDVGCGPGLTLDYLEDRFGAMSGRYLGIDVSRPLICAAQERKPGIDFAVRDIVSEPLPEAAFEYAIINGVLTAKYSLSHGEMEHFARELLSATWRSTAVGLAFNVMSPHVDWERDDLFHWRMDDAVGFCTQALSRHVNVLADYGLYEYVVQVLRAPRAVGAVPRAWITSEDRVQVPQSEGSDA